MDFINELGLIAVGSRLRRLCERIMTSGAAVYRDQNLDFEPSWFPVFRILVDRGQQTVGECAQALGLTHAAVSQTARKLVDRGLIVASRDANDERRRLLSLSDEGRELLPQLERAWADIERALEDAVDYSGINIIAGIAGMESALSESELDARVHAIARTRELSSIDIVDFTPELGPHFARLNLEWLEKYFHVEAIDRRVLGTPEAIIAAGGTILFARHGEDIVGTVALMVDNAGGFELTKMGVNDEWQGRGIGRKLLMAALDRARARGLDRLYLFTNSKLETAVQLYRKVGFRVVPLDASNKYERSDLKMELTL